MLRKLCERRSHTIYFPPADFNERLMTPLGVYKTSLSHKTKAIRRVSYLNTCSELLDTATTFQLAQTKSCFTVLKLHQLNIISTGYHRIYVRPIKLTLHP